MIYLKWKDLSKGEIERMLGIPESQAEVLFDIIQLCNKHGIDIIDLKGYLQDLLWIEDLTRPPRKNVVRTTLREALERFGTTD